MKKRTRAACLTLIVAAALTTAPGADRFTLPAQMPAGSDLSTLSATVPEQLLNPLSAFRSTSFPEQLFAPLSAPFTKQILTLSASSPGISMSQNGRQSESVQALAVGPGLVNLSPSDAYATYQWGLKNDGEFKLVELKAKFPSGDDVYRDMPVRGRWFGLPDLGPDDIESTVTDSVTGIDINIRPAWDLYDQAQNKRSVIVAVIDTGIDISHKELANAMWTNPGEIPGDGIDDDGNGFVDDVHGWNFYSDNNQIFTGEEDSHGTHAAGTIAAARGAYGIAGITDNNYVKIMAVKALGGYNGTGSPDSIIKAIHYAEDNGAVICNLSLGTSSYSKELAETMEHSGMLFVVACGNGGFTGKGYNTDIYPVYPASLPYDNIISVANLLFDGNLSEESNYGPASVDLAAPGTYILSTLPDNNYGFMSGTSMAAPMVTGVAAMLYSYRPDLSLTDVKSILIHSCRKLDTLNGKVASGGILDAYAALTWQ